MSEKHLTRHLLRSLYDSEPSIEELLRFVEDHLDCLCPTCRRAIEDWRREVLAKEPEGIGPDPPDLPLNRPFQEEASSPEGWIGWLASVPSTERVRWTESRKHLLGPECGQALLQATRDSLPDRADEALSYARCAEVIFRTGEPRLDLLAVALAHQGNALRAQSNLSSAEPFFQKATDLLNTPDVADMAAYAEVANLEGSLRKDQRRFTEAERQLRRSAVLYQLLDRPQAAARSLMILGSCLFHAGEIDRALEANWNAMRVLDHFEDPKEFLCSRLNHALYLAEAGDYDQAEDFLSYDEDLFKADGTEWMLLRRRWLEGRIALGREQWTRAERIFVQVRDRFDALNVGYDAALVSLDLAIVYSEQGRLEDLKRLTSDLVAAFRANQLHGEALAALTLLETAAARERASRKLLLDLARFLGLARNDPSHRFRPKIVL